MTWEFRAMRDEDHGYIKRSWLDSYWEIARRRRVFDRARGGDVDPGGEFQGMARAVYYAMYAPIVDALVARSDVFVATTADMRETDVVCGWMATEGDAVHYLLVKPNFRRAGLGRWLVAQVPSDVHVVYTHAPTPAVGARLIPAGWALDPLRRFERRAA